MKMRTGSTCPLMTGARLVIASVARAVMAAEVRLKSPSVSERAATRPQAWKIQSVAGEWASER